ncbi:MAG: hypothetical protein ACJA0Q_000327 [Saprospiraceae bacterium]|jgi:hypothetical protein
MKLDFKNNLNEYGDSFIRLFSFNKEEAEMFKNSLITTVIENKQALVVDQLEFVDAQNCCLTLMLSEEDIGIYSKDDEHFVCELTMKSYKQIVTYIEPFCLKNSKAYRILYDIDSLIDFIFSPSST